jgi:hypothetical protein
MVGSLFSHNMKHCWIKSHRFSVCLKQFLEKKWHTVTSAEHWCRTPVPNTATTKKNSVFIWSLFFLFILYKYDQWIESYPKTRVHMIKSLHSRQLKFIYTLCRVELRFKPFSLYIHRKSFWIIIIFIGSCLNLWFRQDPDRVIIFRTME